MSKNKSKAMMIITGGLGFLGKEFTIELAKIIAYCLRVDLKKTDTTIDLKKLNP